VSAGGRALEGRVALLTGAASGIGLATAARFARAGARVALTFHPDHPHDGEAEAAKLRAEGLDAQAYPVDIADTQKVEALYEQVREHLGPPEIVVANASVGTSMGNRIYDLATWREVLDVNLTGTYQTLAPAIPDMTERGFGRLLVTSSVSGPVVGWPDHAAYCASKAGIAGLVRGLAVDVARAGITVNAVAPGLIRTPMSLDPTHSLGAERIDEVADAIPAGRVGEPDDIAAAFEFLATDGAGYITGQLIVVDGGATLVEAI
jgi:3-oxoacyl-[acyl-carrier protein] reductase